mmetsp:Transcript_29561/g.94851  ORF Transcript_29561/g.94851 Transcript_29561/m.94851 type:complete len:218 (-) Transcript_29561:899-1552(-)
MVLELKVHLEPLPQAGRKVVRAAVVVERLHLFPERLDVLVFFHQVVEEGAEDVCLQNDLHHDDEDSEEQLLPAARAHLLVAQVGEPTEPLEHNDDIALPPRGRSHVVHTARDVRELCDPGFHHVPAREVAEAGEEEERAAHPVRDAEDEEEELAERDAAHVHVQLHLFFMEVSIEAPHADHARGLQYPVPHVVPSQGHRDVHEEDGGHVDRGAPPQA